MRFLVRLYSISQDLLLLCRIADTYVDAAYTITDGVACSVFRSVRWSVCHDRDPAETAEPIEMPFGVWIRVGP